MLKVKNTALDKVRHVILLMPCFTTRALSLQQIEHIICFLIQSTKHHLSLEQAETLLLSPRKTYTG